MKYTYIDSLQTEGFRREGTIFKKMKPYYLAYGNTHLNGLSRSKLIAGIERGASSITLILKTTESAAPFESVALITTGP